MTAIDHEDPYPSRHQIRAEQLQAARDSSLMRQIVRFIVGPPQVGPAELPEPTAYKDDHGTYGDYVIHARRNGNLPQ